jgi:hypothetical protein
MFGTGARFAEYGITGGFFILSQLLLLGWADPGAVGSALQFTGALLANLNQQDLAPLFPAIQSLAVALALLSVFITGLLLDLIGTISVVWEARVFRDHLIRNRNWIERLIETELPDRKRDYVCFLTLLDRISPRSAWSHTFKLSPFWSASERRRRSRITLGLRQRMLQKFRRLEAALVAEVVVAGVKTDLLGEQMSVSRMSRAITLAIFLSALEFCLAPHIPVLWHSLWYLFGISGRGNFLDISSFGLGADLAAVVATVFAIIVVRAAYSRFCLMLFSQVYAISKLSKLG